MESVGRVLNTKTNINTNTTQSFSLLNTNIDIESKNTQDIDPARIESQARELMRKLGAPDSSLEFYCWTYYKLPADTVDRLAGYALEGKNIRNRGAYFNRIVRREVSNTPRAPHLAS